MTLIIYAIAFFIVAVFAGPAVTIAIFVISIAAAVYFEVTFYSLFIALVGLLFLLKLGAKFLYRRPTRPN